MMDCIQLYNMPTTDNMVTTVNLISLNTDCSSTQKVQSYLPPIFNDSNRLTKLHTVFPEIDRMYKEYAEKNHFPGYAYGIMVDGQLAYSGTGGFIDLDKKTPVTIHSMFRIASMTKSFTALAILKLRDENKLKLDDPVYVYIPEAKDLKLTTDGPVITIRDLLMHSAGFPTDDPWADRKLDNTEKEFIELLKKGLFFSNVPGTTYEYSNLGYTMLGYIINKITGASYTKFIDEIIKLQGISWEFEKIPASQLAHGYRWINENWKEEELLHDGIFGAMGGIFASVESFSQYAALHQLAWPPRNDSETGPVKRSSIREMHQPWRFKTLLVDKYLDGRERIIASGYGYGLNRLQDDQGRVFVGHSGGLPGFGSNWYILPEYGIGAILFANVTYAPAAKINLDVLDKLVTAAELKPRHLPASNILNKRKNALVELLPKWENAVTSGIFADNFFLDYPISSLIKETNELFAEAGIIVSVGDLIPENQLRGYFTVKGETMDLRISFALAPETPALIQQFQIKSVTYT